MLHRIWFRFGVALFAAAFVPLAILLFSSYMEIRNGLARQVQDHLFYNARIIAANVEARIVRSRSMLHILAESSVISGGAGLSRAAIENEMKRVQTYFGTFDDLTLVNANGKVLASTTYDYEGDWLGQSWFLRARDGKEALGRAHLSIERKTSIAEMCIPVRRHMDRVLCGRLPLQAGQSAGEAEAPPFSIGDALLGTPPAGEYMEVFLVNERGRILVHRKPQRVFELLPPEHQLRALLATGGGRLWVKSGRAAFYGVAFIPDATHMMAERWAVVVAASAAEALAPLAGYYGGMIVAGLFALVLAVLLAVIFGRSLTVPIRLLVRAVDRLATGDLSARVLVTGSHELAMLGRRFNEMAGDLTEAMQRIRESEQRFRTLVETVDEGIWAVDQKGTILHANPGLERMCGIEGMLGGAVPSYLEIVEPREASITELIDPPVPTQEMLWRTVGGREIWVIYAARRLAQAGRGETATFAVITDITERKSMEHQLARYSQNLERMVEERTNQLAEQSRRLEEALARAERADKSKGDYISRMSHELRTPLNSIMGFADLTLMGISGEAPEKVRRDMKIIKDSAQYLLKMINDILDATKIESGMLDLEIKDVDAAPLAACVLESIRGMVGAKDVTLHNEIPAEGCWVKADEIRLQQVFNNLFSNAAKYTDQGHIRLSAAPHGELCRFLVEDTGIGISAEDIPHIFEEFQQVKGTGREGSGLGLALVRLLVEKMGGHVWVESQKGVGSKFYFTLLVGKTQELLKRRKQRWVCAEPPSRVAVLAADPGAAEIIARELSSAHIARVEIVDARSAKQALAELRPEVVVLAPFSNNGDVFSALLALNEEESFREANPVLAAVDPAAGFGHALGFVDLMATPVTEECLRHLMSLFDRRPRRLLLAQDRFDEAVQTSNLLRRYEIEVVKAFTLADSLELLENVLFDCAMIDITLGLGEGLVLLDKLRQRFSHVPAIVLVPRQISDELRGRLNDVVRRRWPWTKLTAEMLYQRV